MRNLIRLFFLLTFLLHRSNNLLGQGRTGYFVGSGFITYNGDINEKSDKIISNSKVFKPYIKAGINYRLSSRMEISFAYLYGNIGGADSLAKERDNIKRNQSFRSTIHELSAQVEYHLLSVYRKQYLNPFVFAGAGVFRFNPQAELNGKWYDLRPLGTEGQFIAGGGHPKPYKLMQIDFPLGVGIYFQLHKNWRLRFDYTYHITRTDYLDDVSKAYPDMDELAATLNGDLAVQLSNRRLEGFTPPPGRPRGNPKVNDSFTTFGFLLIYNPGELRKGKPHNSKKFSRVNNRLLRKKALCRGGWR